MTNFGATVNSVLVRFIRGDMMLLKMENYSRSLLQKDEEIVT